MKKTLAILPLAFLLLTAAQAQSPAAFRDPQTGKLMVKARYTCPLDGKEFEEAQRAAVYTAGTYLDLKPYGSFEGEFPPLPACPDSGLVMTRKTYTPEQIDKLRAFVASADYPRIREQETRAYMAALQMEQLGEPQARIADRWLKASWSARNPEEYRRYAEAALRQFRQLAGLVERSSGDWVTAQLAGVELERRLGRFDEAAQRLDTLRGDERFRTGFLAQVVALQTELLDRRDTSAQKMPARAPAAASRPTP